MLSEVSSITALLHRRATSGLSAQSQEHLALGKHLGLFLKGIIMAFTKTVTTPCGFSATNAYLRVEGVRLNTKTNISFNLRSYKENSNLPHFADVEYTCAYSLIGANPIAQAYTYLKTLPEFVDAIDC